MLPESITVTAKRIAQRHASFTQTLTAILARTLDQADPTTAKSRSELMRQVLQAAHEHIEAAMGEVGEGVNALMQMGVSDAGIALVESDREGLGEHIDLIREDAGNALVLCSQRDVQAVAGALRRVALVADITRSAGHVSRTTAIIQSRFGAVRELGFHQSDRLGRKWDSTTYVEVMMRGYLLHAYIESRLFALSRGGADLVTVDYPDHAEHELTFSITGLTPGVPTYADVRDEVFHPRSNASVK